MASFHLSGLETYASKKLLAGFLEPKSKYFSKISHEKALKAQELDISLPSSTTIARYTKDFSESTKRFRSQTYCYSRSDFHKARLDVLYCLSV